MCNASLHEESAVERDLLCKLDHVKVGMIEGILERAHLLPQQEQGEMPRLLVVTRHEIPQRRGPCMCNLHRVRAAP